MWMSLDACHWPLADAGSVLSFVVCADLVLELPIFEVCAMAAVEISAPITAAAASLRYIVGLLGCYPSVPLTSNVRRGSIRSHLIHRLVGDIMPPYGGAPE